MITRQNITSVFNAITEQQITSAMQSLRPFFVLTLGGYGDVYLETTDYSEELEEEVQSNGGLFCDTEDFFRLFKESQSLNPFLIEYL